MASTICYVNPKSYIPCFLIVMAKYIFELRKNNFSLRRKQCQIFYALPVFLISAARYKVSCQGRECQFSHLTLPLSQLYLNGIESFAIADVATFNVANFQSASSEKYGNIAPAILLVWVLLWVYIKQGSSPTNLKQIGWRIWWFKNRHCIVSKFEQKQCSQEFF